MSKEIRQSKIYSYFYGAGTVFQQFLIIVGALVIALTPMAQQSKRQKTDRLYSEYSALQQTADDLEQVYLDKYYDLDDDYYYSYYYYYDSDDEEDYEMYEEIEVDEDDEDYDEIVACNEALNEYETAAEQAQAAYDRYETAAYSASPAEVLFPLIGGIIVLAALIWIIAKKKSFNKKPGEEAYDEEIQIKIEEAKLKALDKLNIVAEQIDKVEPVVLNGIADYDTAANKNPIGKVAAMFQHLVKLISSISTLILGSIAGALYFAFGMFLSQNGVFVLAVIGAFALSAVAGFMLYKKYEQNAYVSPKTIKKLEGMYPNLIFKLGSDDNIRVSLPAITVYMFSDEQIYMYYQYFDIVTGKIFCEGIHEYFYEDIVGVVSKQETKKIFKRAGFLKLSLKAIDYLKENITVVSSGCQHSESYIVPMGSSLLDTKFVGMRNLIRQKKADNE